MNETRITFESIPSVLMKILEKLNEIESFIHNSQNKIEDKNNWMDLDEFREYHPDKPKKQTVYGWVCWYCSCT